MSTAFAPFLFTNTILPKQNKPFLSVCLQKPHRFITYRAAPSTSMPIRILPTCVWVERSASVIIEMDTVECFDYYTDLEAMPQWYVYPFRLSVSLTA